MNSERGTISALADPSATDPEGPASAPCARTAEHTADTHERIARNIDPSLPALSINHQLPQLSTPTPLQPVSDVAGYLAARRSSPRFEQERPLFITLPNTLRDEIETLFAAIDLVEANVKAGLSVNKSCHQVAGMISLRGSWKTFRADYDLWKKTGDWVTLVNRAKAGAAWQARADGLPAEFTDFCAIRIGSYVRRDARAEALRSVKRQWRTGRDKTGALAPIPGYGYWQDWFSAIGYRQLAMPRRPIPHEAPEPSGWTLSNILRAIKARNALPKAVHELLLQGTAAARAHLPRVHSTRAALRFMEQIQFDDVRTDFVVFDTLTGQPMDLWILIAHDVATGILLGFGMRPARTRDDGTQDHLKLRDVKQLLGWLLERFGLPPYIMHWKFEHGTATLSQGSRHAILELLPGSIEIHFSSMIGGKSPRGYQEKTIGNSAGKASLESHNRLLHIIGADLPGQIGPHYGVRPMDIAARTKESVLTWQIGQHLPETIRGQLGYSLVTLAQARTELTRIFGIRNHRTDHNLEGFADILEWYDEATGKWMPQTTYAGKDAFHCVPKIRNRKESPVERAERLVRLACTAGQHWTSVSPDIIAAFYEHTQRQVVVKPSGLIDFTIEGRPVEFMPPELITDHRSLITPGQKLLAYFHPDDPAYLHLTNGRGGVVGTWLRRNLAHDQDSLQQAIRYSQAALTAARNHAAKLAAPDVQSLETMRARNAELLQANTFVEVSSPLPSAIGHVQTSVAVGLTSVARTRQSIKQCARVESARIAADGPAAADDILSPSTINPQPSTASDPEAADDFLRTISTPEQQ